MWQAIFDESQQKYSYKNSETGQSTWTRPFDYVPRAEDFEERYDEEMQEPVFFDKTTGKTRHTRPDCLALPPTKGTPQVTHNPLNIEMTSFERKPERDNTAKGKENLATSAQHPVKSGEITECHDFW
mmetsp:Transcript_29277/g.58458  ORF Transcript_29277/g.58458 Transcript_29277/m.58458 type:complete len:127 (+) Transcript_29277:145-525(+)